MINALANHGILPHNGKGITKAMAVDVLTKSINLDSTIANVFAIGALTTNPDHSAHSFDLDHLQKHGVIEHDVSLSRSDLGLGDNHTFDKNVFEGVLASYGDAKETNFELASKARYERMVAAKKAHEVAKKDFQYGIKEFILSKWSPSVLPSHTDMPLIFCSSGYGESALFLGILGDPKDGKIPLEYLKVLFRKLFQSYSM